MNEKDYRKSTILVEVTENDYWDNFYNLIQKGKPFEWSFPTLEDKSHHITIKFISEED